MAGQVRPQNKNKKPKNTNPPKPCAKAENLNPEPKENPRTKPSENSILVAAVG
jgi:hypothetical protein